MNTTTIILEDAELLLLMTFAAFGAAVAFLLFFLSRGDRALKPTMTKLPDAAAPAGWSELDPAGPELHVEPCLPAKLVR